jgi:hypothetical protein
LVFSLSSGELTGGVILKFSCNLLSSWSLFFWCTSSLPSTLQFLQDKLIAHTVRSDVLMQLHCHLQLYIVWILWWTSANVIETTEFCIPQGPAKLFPSTHLSEVHNVAHNILHISQSLSIHNGITQFKCCSVQHKVFSFMLFPALSLISLWPGRSQLFVARFPLT